MSIPSKKILVGVLVFAVGIFAFVGSIYVKYINASNSLATGNLPILIHYNRGLPDAHLTVNPDGSGSLYFSADLQRNVPSSVKEIPQKILSYSALLRVMRQVGAIPNLKSGPCLHPQSGVLVAGESKPSPYLQLQETVTYNGITSVNLICPGDSMSSTVSNYAADVMLQAYCYNNNTEQCPQFEARYKNGI